MIRLRLKGDGTAEKVDLGYGVNLVVRPVTTALMAAARSRLDAAALEEEAPAVQVVHITKEVAALAIVDWSGVGDENGDEIPPDEAAISALLDIELFYNAFFHAVMVPAMTVDDLGNGSSRLPSGGSAAGATTAAPADRPASTARGGRTRQN